MALTLTLKMRLAITDDDTENDTDKYTYDYTDDDTDGNTDTVVFWDDDNNTLSANCKGPVTCQSNEALISRFAFRCH